MKICFLMPHHWSSTLGGAELQVRYLMDYAARHTSHELQMICCHSSMALEDGVPILQSRPSLPIRRYTLASDYFSVLRLLRGVAPDVVYTRTRTPLVGFAARYCRQHGKSLVYHIAHASDVSPPRDKGRRAFLKRLERPLYEYGLRRANAIVAQAEYQRELLLRNYRLDAAAVIPNFPPIPAPAPALAKKHVHERTVLWVANLKPAKRPELFIELAQRCAHMENTRFVMIGAVQDPRYASLGAETATPGNLTIMGYRPVEEVNRLLASADLFVNTSRHDGEGFPNTFIQAWLNSTPVVSLDVDPDGVLATNGIGVCSRGDLEHMTRNVQSLLLDDDGRRAMGRAARSFAEAHHGPGNCGQLIELMEALRERPVRDRLVKVPGEAARHA
jgi:glycosyltransferase involved in cell wall biosynthesis